jgi:hypothetical protein
MKRLFARKLRLRLSIVVLFVLLTVPVFFTSLAVTYVSNEEIARTNADALIERFRTDAIGNIQSMFNPIKSAGAQRRDGRRSAARFLFRQPLAQISLQRAAAQRQADQRLCRHG